MVLHVTNYGAVRHQPSTAWFVTYNLRAQKNTRRTETREAIGTSASKAREKVCEDKEIRSREYKMYKRVALCFMSKITMLSGTNRALDGT